MALLQFDDMLRRVADEEVSGDAHGVNGHGTRRTYTDGAGIPTIGIGHAFLLASGAFNTDNVTELENFLGTSITQLTRPL